MANLLDLSPDEFMFTLQEFGYSPERRDELIRQYREHNSVFGALNRAAQERQAEIAGEGRRPVAGGFLSKPEGSLGMDAVRGLRVEPMAGLLGMLTGAGRAVEAPSAAARGLIPIDDIPLEALGTAGMASLGGAAMTRPAGSVGMGGRMAAAEPRNAAERMARDILDMRAAGRAGEVTDAMMAQADPQYMFANTPLPMDEASRMVRAGEMFPDIAFHATGRDFDQFIPSEFRGASFFATTPDGASRGAAASANEGVGSGSNMVLPVRVNTSKVEGLGAYGQRDMNDFRASLPNRVFSEPEMDVLMASDAAPRYSNWTHFFDDLTDYDALRQFREKNPDDPIPDGIIGYQPRQPLRYASGLRSDISGRQFAHYSEGMSERPISDYAKSIGNTGFTMMDESGLALAVTDPSTIRSRFARFDPEFSHLSNLNAANVDPLAGLFGVLAAEEQRRQRNGQ